MTNKRCFPNVMQIIFSLALAVASPCLLCTSVHSQDTTSKQPTPRSPAKIPPELCLLGVWSYEATTHGVPAESGGDLVQRGHLAVTYSDGAYMTAFLFDQANVAGKKCLFSVSTQNDKMIVERIDVFDSYTKHFGICRVNEDGVTIELAFNNPLDGSKGSIPSSFDPKFEPKGFVTIKLKRLSERPTDQIKVIGVSGEPSRISQR